MSTTDSDDQIHECDICGAGFSTAQELHGHIQGTGGEGSDHRAFPRFETNHWGHEQWATSERGDDNGNTTVQVHRLIVAAEKGVDALDGKIVHHKNHIPWDNRTENLELMTNSEHTAYHQHLDRIPEPDLIEELQVAEMALGRPPKAMDMDNWGEYHSSTYTRRFGSWEKALQVAGINPGGDQA